MPDAGGPLLPPAGPAAAVPGPAAFADVLGWLATHYNYAIYILLMMIGLYAVLAKGNLVKKVIGLNLLQTAVFLFYLSIGKIDGATAPVVWTDRPPGAEGVPYENPVPHVLMLTAIVVGVSVTAVALALVVRIREAYGTVDEGEILASDEAQEEAESARAEAQEAAADAAGARE